MRKMHVVRAIVGFFNRLITTSPLASWETLGNNAGKQSTLRELRGVRFYSPVPDGAPARRSSRLDISVEQILRFPGFAKYPSYAKVADPDQEISQFFARGLDFSSKTANGWFWEPSAKGESSSDSRLLDGVSISAASKPSRLGRA